METAPANTVNTSDATATATAVPGAEAVQPACTAAGDISTVTVAGAPEADSQNPKRAQEQEEVGSAASATEEKNDSTTATERQSFLLKLGRQEELRSEDEDVDEFSSDPQDDVSRELAKNVINRIELRAAARWSTNDEPRPVPMVTEKTEANAPGSQPEGRNTEKGHDAAGAEAGRNKENEHNKAANCESLVRRRRDFFEKRCGQ